MKERGHDRSSTAGVALVVAAWLCVAVGSLTWLIRAASVPGAADPAPVRFARGSSLERSRTVPTLHVFLHPRCPCSSATVAGLSALLASASSKVAVEIVFALPRGVPSSWARTPLREEAAAIPGVRVRDDVGCVEARRFGVRTSGDALLHDTDGTLLFRGGLTVARGHHGASGGSAAVLALVGGRRPGALLTWPVFGCPLEVSEEGS